MNTGEALQTYKDLQKMAEQADRMRSLTDDFMGSDKDRSAMFNATFYFKEAYKAAMESFCSEVGLEESELEEAAEMWQASVDEYKAMAEAEIDSEFPYEVVYQEPGKDRKAVAVMNQEQADRLFLGLEIAGIEFERREL